MIKYPDSIWYGLKERCKIGGAQQRVSRTYIGCSVGFSGKKEFMEWIIGQPGYDRRDEKGRRYHLDKDLIIEGNKIYGPDQCSLVPARINCLLVDCGVTASGGLPGSSWHKASGMYQSRAQNYEGRKHLGVYPSRESAHNAWRVEKSLEILRAIDWYLDTGWHDPRVVIALEAKAIELSKQIQEG